MFSREEAHCEICGTIVATGCVVFEGFPHYEELCTSCKKAVKDAKEQQLKLAKHENN